MSVSAPPRPPAPGPVDPDELEALIEEARRRARRRRLLYTAGVGLAVLVGVALYALLEPIVFPGSDSSAPAARTSVVAAAADAKIAFLRIRNGPGRQDVYELYVTNADGSGKRKLAQTPWAIGAAGFRAGPAWSPDGRQLAFTIQLPPGRGLCDRAGACNDEIYVIDADGTGLRRLTRNAVPDGPASWSPDGKTIGFLSWRGRTGADIFVMNPDGSDERQLTRRPGNEGGPDWSPDGQTIAFTAVPPRPVVTAISADGPPRDVYVMNADGSDQRNLTNTPAAAEQGADWSPGGRSLAFGTSDGPPWGVTVFVMNADGSGKHRVTRKVPDTFNVVVA
jgi:Tol biopolymer transport system component